MVRRRIEIKPIQDKPKRFTAFSKRRPGLAKKLKQLCERCDAQGASIVFSQSGNVFAFGHPTVESVVDRYLDEQEADDGEGRLHAVGEVPVAEAETETEKRIRSAMENGGWNTAVEGLGFHELDELEAEVRKIKAMIAAAIGKRGFSRHPKP